MNPKISFWIALVCSQLITLAVVAVPVSAATSSKQASISERVQKVRETLSQPGQNALDNQELGKEDLMSQTWDNWGNFNWYNWSNMNWYNWDNWSNWDNWDNT